MVVYQPWTGPQSRHTSHEKDYFEQRKSMVKFLQGYDLGKLSKTDEQTLHYLTNKCPLEHFSAKFIKDHELDNWEKKINKFLEIEFEPTNEVILCFHCFRVN